MPAEARFKLLLLFCSTAVGLSIGEMYFRQTSPYIIRKAPGALKGIPAVSGDYGYFMDTLSGRRLIPNARVVRVTPDGRKVSVNVNSNGFRDDEIPVHKPAEETRILFLGDSITFGGAEVDAAATYPKRVEAHLRETASPGRLIRCVNGGVEGIGTKDEIDILVEQGLEVSPDVVVVGFYLNDGNPPDRLAAGLANPGLIRRHSVLVQAVYRAYKSWQFRSGNLEEARMYDWQKVPPPKDWRTDQGAFLRYAANADKDWGAAWEPATWVGIREQMVRLRGLSEKHGFKVVVLALPIAFQVHADYVEDVPQRRLGALSRELRFGFFDVLPRLRALVAAERRYKSLDSLYYDAVHMTKEGHDVVGRELARFLAESPFLKGRPR